MRPRRLLLLAALVAAAVAPSASAGGWATVQLSAVPSDDTRPGSTLPIDITVLQHGKTPLAGVTPVFRVRDEGGKLLASYRGAATGTTGVYHVDVRIPSAGTFRYEVYDGFTQYGNATTHTYAPVRLSAPATHGDGFPTAPVAAVALALAAALGAALLLHRRGRREVVRTA
jgi:hypothetical protein